MEASAFRKRSSFSFESLSIFPEKRIEQKSSNEISFETEKYSFQN